MGHHQEARAGGKDVVRVQINIYFLTQSANAANAAQEHGVLRSVAVHKVVEDCYNPTVKVGGPRAGQGSGLVHGVLRRFDL